MKIEAFNVRDFSAIQSTNRRLSPKRDWSLHCEPYLVRLPLHLLPPGAGLLGVK